MFTHSCLLTLGICTHFTRVACGKVYVCEPFLFDVSIVTLDRHRNTNLTWHVLKRDNLVLFRKLGQKLTFCLVHLYGSHRLSRRPRLWYSLYFPMLWRRRVAYSCYYPPCWCQLCVSATLQYICDGPCWKRSAKLKWRGEDWTFSLLIHKNSWRNPTGNPGPSLKNVGL